MMNTMIKIATAALLLAIVAGCCPCRKNQSKNHPPLVETEWQLVQLAGQGITPSDDTYTLLFGADGRLSGMGACNRLMGSYTTGEKNSLQIGPLASTRMACPGMDKESEYMQAVQTATRYDMDGDMLLLLQDKTLKAVFQARTK